MFKFDSANKDVIVKIALMLDLPELLSLCRSSTKFNKVVCQNKNFWISKLYQDYKIRYLDISLDHKGDPKEYYEFFLKRRKKGEHFIIKSVDLDKLDIFKYLLPKYLSSGNEEMKIQFLFNSAALNDSMKVFNYLLDNYSDDLSLDKAMELSARIGNLPMVKHLVELGANSFHWAMKNALMHNQKHIVEYLKTKII